MNKTKPDLRCTIEELNDLEVLPFGWVLLRRGDKDNPDFIDIKLLGGLDPLDRIAQLEAENARLQELLYKACTTQNLQGNLDGILVLDHLKGIAFEGDDDEIDNS